MRYNPAQRGGGIAVAEPPAPVGRVTPCAPTVVATNQTTGTLPVASSPPKPGGLKKISFAKPAKKEETKTEYPVFQGDEHTRQQVFDIAARIKTRADEIESLTGAQDTDKAELKMFVLPFYFQVNRGRSEPPSSIAIKIRSVCSQPPCVPARVAAGGQITKRGAALAPGRTWL